MFPDPSQFEVRHDYLLSGDPATQARLRKRGNGMKYMYTHTICKRIAEGVAEARMQLSSREYDVSTCVCVCVSLSVCCVCVCACVAL